MHDPEARPDLRRMIEEVVAGEGPVVEEIVLQRVREQWGVGRAGSRIRVTIGCVGSKKGSESVPFSWNGITVAAAVIVLRNIVSSQG